MKAFKQLGLIALSAMAMLSCSSLTDLTAGLTAGAPGVEKGAFSVSANTKVFFAKGNLQYQASTVTWRFAENQWDYMGDANSGISDDNEDWIDLFGWGTGNAPSKYKNHYWEDYTSFNDWGKNTIINGEDYNWFTLSQDEWNYIFETRKTSSGILYAKAIVNGVNGLILLPDSWSTFGYPLNEPNKEDASFGSNRISQKVWTEKFEANGAIFLPAAGYRNEKDVIKAGTSGYYWKCTGSGPVNSRSVIFGDGFVYWDQRENIHQGFSVRLARTIE